MDTFSKLHPGTILLYYSMAVFLMILYGHPVVTGIIWIIAFATYASFGGAGKGGKMALGSIGVIFLCLIMNPLLNHRGVTLLFMLGDSRITKEAVFYGGNMALILLASVFLFACFSHYMTAEKIMTLLGKRLPSFALLFSMILRFAPKAKKDYKEFTYLHGNKPAVWSAFIGMSLEDALARSLSMKSRGYGSGGRISYYRECFKSRDIVILILILGMGVQGIWCFLHGMMAARFFPSMKIRVIPVWEEVLLVLFYSIPLIMRGKEEISWLLSRRRITVSSIRNRQSQR